MKDNTQNKNTQKNKKRGIPKVVLIIIILIMAAIIGLLSWMVISGKDFSTIFNKVVQSEDKKDNKEEKNDEKNNQNNETAKEKDNNASDKGTENKKTSNTTNLKDSFKVTYETRGVRNITIGGASFVCNEDVPHISGISSTASAKMEKYLTDWYSRVWVDINAQTSDDYIKELLTQMNEASEENDGYGPYDIGFHQSYEVIYLTDKLVTFGYTLGGGLGGVGWGNASGVSFDLETGDVIEIKNLVKSKEKYIEACKKSVYDQLQKDSRYNEVVELHGDSYQSIINSAIEKLDGYFTKDGIMCVEIPKYEISSGAAGEFQYAVPYSLVENYIDTKYLENKNSSNINSNTNKEYTTEELEKMALDYYEAKTGYRPSRVGSQKNDDGTISIQLYDNMGDHNSTSDWYTVDPKTAVGTDITKNKIDLKTKPARE